MITTAIKLYKEYNPGKPIKSPRAKIIKRESDENYGVRWFNKNRFRDILSLVAIDKQEELAKKMLPKTPSKMKYYRDVLNCSDNHQKYKFYVFALTDHNNEIIGWVQYTPDENISKLKKLIKIERKAVIFEVSYAKLFSQKLKGVGVSGLKQTLEVLRKMDNNDLHDIYITGYTEQSNIASEYVLNTNRFEMLKTKIMYEGELNNVWIRKIN